MLIKAEACIMKDNADFQTAFSLINAVNKRARNYAESVKKKSSAMRILCIHGILIKKKVLRELCSLVKDLIIRNLRIISLSTVII